MKKSSIALFLALSVLTACHHDSTTATDDESVAAKAGAAGFRARKKAQELKQAEDQKAKETDNAGE